MKLLTDFSNKSIRRKLLIFLVTFILLTGVAVFSTLIYIYKDFSRQTLTMASKTLSLYTEQLNDALDQISAYSANLMFDSDIQEKLKTLSVTTDSYEQLLLKSYMNNKLFLSASALPFLDHIDILTINDIYLTSAPERIRYSDQDYDDYVRIAEKKGGCIWEISVEDQSEKFRLYRLIQTINDNLNHEPLGILTFTIDVEQLMELESFHKDYYQSCFLITSQDGTILYQSEDSKEFAGLSRVTTDAFHSFDNNSYFVTTASSHAEDWIYWMLILKKDILGHVISVTLYLTLLFVILILVYIFVCIHFSARISRPLIHLSRSMDAVAGGDFDIAVQGFPDISDNEELRMIRTHFLRMVQQLDTLITENYKVKLLNRDAQLSALQAQIDPHFLYNALDSVNWLAKLAKQPQISTIVQSLAALMRQTMDTSKKEYYLKDELKLIEHYLAIQQIRYGKRLCVSTSVDDTLMELPVPKLILQPFFENSIRYVLEDAEYPCEIALSIKKDQGFCYIDISDNGSGIDEELVPRILAGQIQAKGNGVGIKNVNDRMKLLYSEAVEKPLKIGESETGGTWIRLQIPLPAELVPPGLYEKEIFK